MVIFMNEFKSYHPVVNFFYFFCVICFSCVFMHPVCLLISLSCGFLYYGILKGKEAVVLYLKISLPTLVFTAILNPAFNHKGITVLTYLPSGNPLTSESVVYGICAAMMIVSVMAWFFCFNEVITSDKIIYLFGRIAPSLSLIFSMILRFVPKFSNQLKQVANGQRCLNGGNQGGGVIKRAKCGLGIFSATVTMALENSVETADSMRAKGYGTAKRTSFSIFKFDSRDKKMLIFMVVSAGYIIFGKLLGAMKFEFFPELKGVKFTAISASFFAVYMLFCICPVAIEVWEAKKWKYLKSKI